MKDRYRWMGLGAGAAFFLATLVSIGLGGPGWPWFLGAGCLTFLVILGLSMGWFGGRD